MKKIAPIQPGLYLQQTFKMVHFNGINDTELVIFDQS